MRPNDSAPSLARFCKSPLGAFLLHSLLLGLWMTSAAAQTRLDSSQITPLKGDAQGPFASTKVRDLNSAEDHGNGTTNGIASAIADCGVTFSCSIIVPPSYGTSEAVPGYQLNYNVPGPPATTPGNIAIFDQRYSDARMFVNNHGFSIGFINAPSGWLYDYYSPAAPNETLAALYIREWSLDGGTNQNSAALNYANKTTWASTLLNSISHSPGQHVSVTLSGQATSLGNYTAINNLVSCNGGFASEGDLGCHAIDNIVALGNVEYSGTLSGSLSTGATSLSVSPTQGKYTQGSGRFLARMNAGTISAGTISQISTSGNGATGITGSGTAWPISTVIAQLGANVAIPGSATVTPTSFTVGSMAAIQTSSLICVADGESYEMLYPSSVTANGFTANFAKIHPSTASISVGGLCGYLLDLTADDVTNVTYPTKTQTITGTLHFAWPVLATTSPTSATVWVAADGYWQQIVSRWNASAANGYVLYPFAEVISTQQAGGLSDNLTVGPNQVAWASGDTVAEFLYPAVHALFGNSVVESYYPNMGTTNGFSLKYNLPLQGSESMISLINNAPVSLYHSKGGIYGSPSGLHIVGETNQSFTADLPAEQATIGIGCAAPCTSSENLIAVQNSGYYDFVFYDPSHQRWTISTNSLGGSYGFAGNQFTSAFANLSLASDTNSVGYVSTQQLRSAVSANSDSSGEMAFTNTTTATQNLHGTYASHPECLVRPQFDAGSTNRYWVTYSGNSFTVNFATAVTGIVNYSCAARN